MGRALVIVSADAPRQPVLWFMSNDGAPTLTRRPLSLPMPDGADEVLVWPFDRAGVPFVAFSTSRRPQRGGPPTLRLETGRSCGVMALTASGVEQRPLREFLLNPPRDLGAAVEIDPEDCRYLTPELVMPAVAASRIPLARSGSVRAVELVRADVTPNTGDEHRACVHHVTLRIDARDSNGAVRWSHALADEYDGSRCPGAAVRSHRRPRSPQTRQCWL